MTKRKVGLTKRVLIAVGIIVAIRLFGIVGGLIAGIIGYLWIKLPLLEEKPYVVDLGDKGDVEGLIKALGGRDSFVRGDAAMSLGSIGDVRAVEPLIQALNDEDYIVRADAAYAHGDIGDARAVEPLTQALNDENSDVRAEAKDALNKIKAEKS